MYKDELTEAYEELYRNNPELKETHEEVCVNKDGEEYYFEKQRIITPLQTRSKEELFPQTQNVKHMIIYWAHKAGCFTHQEIGDSCGLTEDTIHNIVYRMHNQKEK